MILRKFYKNFLMSMKPELHTKVCLQFLNLVLQKNFSETKKIVSKQQAIVCANRLYLVKQT